MSPETAQKESRRRIRVAVSAFYFCMGLCFATWASRIPDIKSAMDLSEATLGSLLFALPVGQFIGMPFSGGLVTRFGSRRVMSFAVVGYAICLVSIGASSNLWLLGAALLVFGICGNMCNIAVNTQGVAVEEIYSRSIMSSFHGVWSAAGFSGAMLGLLSMSLGFSTLEHFVAVALVVLAVAAANRSHLIVAQPLQAATKRPFFIRPRGALLHLGIIAFCCMLTEGAMFDWSGVYFKEVIRVRPELVPLGYASFMIMMALGRFLADRLIGRIGRRRLIRTSGVVISGGIFLAVALPYVLPATLAFMMVGLGVSAVVPTVYSAAGKTSVSSPGLALAAVTSIGFLGFLMGPPLIGWIAAVSNLRWSFAVIGLGGIGITLLVSRIKTFD